MTSDHGESLTERDACYFTHDPFLYEETLRVPLVMRFPEGRYAGTVVESLARGIDVLPTLRQIAGLPLAGGEQGTSLIGRIEGRDPTEYLLYAQTQTHDAKERSASAEDGAWLEHRVALSDGRHKLIHDYFEVDSEVVWRTATVNVPEVLPLIAAAAETLRP